jgi:hypothetical protein
MAVLAGVLALTTACGSSSPAAHSTAAAQNDLTLKWTACMRQNGIAVPDPTPGGSVSVPSSAQGTPQLASAVAACKKYAQPSSIDQSDPKVRDYMVKMAQCLRAHGVNVPDPQPGQNMSVQQNQLNDNSTKTAAAACRKQLGSAPAGSQAQMP